MTLIERVGLLVRLGHWMRSEPEVMSEAIVQASRLNPWFDVGHIRKSISAICEQYLDEKLLNTWINEYDIPEKPIKSIGLILAGNIPLVGFQDILCVFVSGNKSKIKQAQKDQTLLPVILEIMLQWDNRAADYFEIVERLKDIDAVIATGSDNTARYFEYYFGAYPHIIRKNRVGVAILTGNESNDDLTALGEDVFLYYGLGCRNVSSLMVPRGYDFKPLLVAWEKYKYVKDNNSYHNNYDYNAAIYIMGNQPYLSNEAIILIEDDALVSRIAALNYRYYESLESVFEFLNQNEDKIQVVISNISFKGVNSFSPGKAQKPLLNDYADGVDTLNFLIRL